MAKAYSPLSKSSEGRPRRVRRSSVTDYEPGGKTIVDDERYDAEAASDLLAPTFFVETESFVYRAHNLTRALQLWASRQTGTRVVRVGSYG